MDYRSTYLAEFVRVAEALAKNTVSPELAASCSAALSRALLPAYCSREFSEMHLESFARWDAMRAGEILIRKGTRLAIAAPRGNAKSTVHSLALPLLDVLFQRERFIVMISATLAQAAGRLANLRRQLQSNPCLESLVPGYADRTKRFTANTVEIGDTRIDAYGAGAEIRGISHNEFRPTKIILDDVEDSEAVRNSERRRLLREWFDEVVQNLGDSYTHIEVVGTVMHPRSLLAELLARPDFTAKHYASVIEWSPRTDLWDQWEHLLMDIRNPQRNEQSAHFLREHFAEMTADTRVLWHEKEDYPELMRQKATRGRAAFFKEKMNAPIVAEESVFHLDAWPRFELHGDRLVFDGPHRQLDTNLSALRIYGFLDPATGNAGPKGDYSALIVIGVKETQCYVLDLWLGHEGLEAQAKAVIEKHARWQFLVFGFEANGFQGELLGLMRSEPLAKQPRISAVRHNRPKRQRIQTMETQANHGGVALARHLPEEFEIQAEAFPHGNHDDALDALAGALDLSRGSGFRKIQTVRTLDTYADPSLWD